MSQTENPGGPRVRWTLLALLWVWAALIFVVVDLFLDVEEFDRVRPRSRTYQGMRSVAHQMVGGSAAMDLPDVRTVPVVTANRVASAPAEQRHPVRNPRIPPPLRTDAKLAYVEHGGHTQWNDPGKQGREGEYKAGRRVGRWTWNWTDGTLREERHYEKGLLHGRVASWYEGEARERVENYERGKRSGAWQAWYADGTLAAEDHYEGGKPHGEFKRWHENGRQAAARTFESGLASGNMTVWHENGQRKVTGRFVNGKKEGRWSMFDEQGNLQREIVYRDGQRERKDQPVGIAKLPERK